ncbi:hypothetical protein EVAR_33668_1 [Eumeta japonica]|uniref:Uncharacterized protein n=1 Tax=Eumeta variegata TaxID=151549 RepID=A0A4C1VNV8_EUMVA|nr:hypothetical protein EVAR_33668_1 [Eumeta japonica]
MQWYIIGAVNPVDTIQRSELTANYAVRRFRAPRPSLPLPRLPILHHCNSFVTDFTAAQFRALYCRTHWGKIEDHKQAVVTLTYLHAALQPENHPKSTYTP